MRSVCVDHEKEVKQGLNVEAHFSPLSDRARPSAVYQMKMEARKVENRNCNMTESDPVCSILLDEVEQETGHMKGGREDSEGGQKGWSGEGREGGKQRACRGSSPQTM